MAAVSAAEREAAACSAAGSPAEPVSAELVPVGAAAEASEDAAASRASGTYSPAGREIAAEAAVEPSAEAGCTTAASDYWGHWVRCS